ncbi:dehydratase [Baekduia soli]|uniref:Dehydratase n=2 Tax=Baekduia soli TaxID=496014 RepID=A0A5B8UCY4_9ACTN|nr:dehydratase [Baekduia soli]
MAFAGDWDPLPMHVDEAAADRGAFGGLIASGLHTLAIAVRLTVDALVSHTAVYAGREIRSVRMHRPVRPGMTLTGTVTIVEQRLRDDGRGVVVWEIALVDDAGGPVLTMATDSLVDRRP